MIHTWLNGVRNKLISDLAVTEFTDIEHNIVVLPDGQPIATAGKQFIAIHSQEFSADEGAPGGNISARVVYEITCTVTVRARDYPHDKEGIPVYLKTRSSLSYIAMRVRDSLSNNLELLETVKSAAVAENGSANVVEPLAWSRTGPVVPRDKAWFRSRDTRDDDVTPAGYSLDVVFRGGKTIFTKNCPEPT